MKNISYEFMLGKFKCQSVSDGEIPQPTGGLPVTCLLVRTENHLVLIDTGEGPKVNPTTGQLLQNLKDSGVNPGDIDTVVNTHAHVDHVGGNTDLDGKPIYPNAKYYIYKKEWDYWQGQLKLKPGEEKQNETMHMPYVRRAFTSIPDRYVLMGDDKDIVTRIRLRPYPAHSRKHYGALPRGQAASFVGDLRHEVAEFSNLIYGQWDTTPD